MGFKINLSGILFILTALIGIILCGNIAFAYPSNSMIRVCIMDSKYTTVEKTDVTIYGTDEIIIHDTKDKNEYFRIPKSQYLNISKENGIYKLSYINSETEEPEIIELKKDFSVTCPNGVLGIKNLIRGGKPALYRGEFRFITSDHKKNTFYLVNVLDVEYYLKGVVPSEMPVHFGQEALKAQAVAARVYSLTPRTRMTRAFDVVDSVASQVYNGYNRESDIANKAIDETHGIVALYNDEMIIAVFSSTAGGYTECYSETFSDPVTGQFPSPDKPYLTAKPDLPEFKNLDNEEEAFKFYSSRPVSYDMYSPLYRWTKTWTKQELQNILKNNLVVQSKTGFVIPKLLHPDDFGELKDIRVVQRGLSGKIVFMEIETDKMIYTVGKELVIRRLFTKDGKALPSANAVFKPAYKNCNSNNSENISDTTEKEQEWDEITAYGGGFGHGCGLSQYGAMYMAKNCRLTFDTILKHYYNGITLGTKPVELHKSPVTQCFYAPSKKTVLVIPNLHGLHRLEIKINDEITNIDLKHQKGRIEYDISEYIKPKSLNVVTITPDDENHRHDRIKPVKMYIKFE